MNDDEHEVPAGSAEGTAEGTAEDTTEDTAEDTADEALIPLATTEQHGPEGEVVEASEVRRRGRALLFGGLGLLSAVVLGGLGVSLYSSALTNEEASEWTRAEHGRDEAAWQRYVTWAHEAEEGGGLRAFLLARMSRIEAHALVAAEGALTARADAAATSEDWPVLCALLRDHGTTPAADHARTALRGRVERGIAVYRQSIASHQTPPEVAAAVLGALEAARDANPCATGVNVAVVPEVSDEPAFAANVGSRSIAAVLREALDEARGRAVIDALTPELARITNGVLAIREPQPENELAGAPILTVLVRARVGPSGTFLTPSRRELPGIELGVSIDVTSPAPAAAIEAGPTPNRSRNELATYRLPQDFGLELFGEETSDDGVASAYERMVDLLYPHVRERLGQVLGTESFQHGGGLDYGCVAVRPIAANRSLEGTTRGASDTHIGSCLVSDEEDSDYDGDYEGDYPEMPELGYRLVVPTRSEVAVVVDADFSAGLYLRRSCSGSPEDLACDAEDAQIEATLDPGVYYVFVDGTYDDEEGDFTVYAAVHDVEDVARACRAAPTAALGQTVTGTTVGHADVMQGECGGVGGGEVLQTLEVPPASRLRCSLEGSGHVMYLRGTCASRASETGCVPSSTSGRAEITALASGRLTLGVDAEREGEGAYSWRCDAVPREGVDGVAADSCAAPGAIDLSTGNATLDVDTFPAKDDMHGACGGTGAPDLVYRFEVREPSLLSTRWASPGFRGSLTVRASCAPDAGELACARATAGTLTAQLAAGTYFLTIDGDGASSFGRGQLALELESLTRVCESGPMLRSGQREAITIPSGTRSRFTGSCGGGYGSEVVRRFAVERRSQVVATAEMPFAGVLYLRRQCSDDHSEVACVPRTGTGSATIDTALEPGLYYLVVDAVGTTPVGSIGVRVDITSL